MIDTAIRDKIDTANKAWIEALATAERCNRVVSMTQIHLDNAIHARDKAYEESTAAFNALMAIYKEADHA